MLYRKLGLCITEKCTAACGICCFSCSPDKDRGLSDDVMRSYIEEAASYPEMTVVGFTGGEPMLEYDRILELTAYASSLGLNVTVNTNGFFGADPGKWESRLYELKKAGLGKVYFSSDCYHQEFVPAASIKTAIQLVKNAGIEAGLSVLESETTHNAEYLKQFLGPVLDNVSFDTSFLVPAGRAAGSMPPSEFPGLVDPKKAPCCFDFALQISYDGFIYLCCSQFSREIPLLKRGRTGIDTLKDVNDGAMRDNALYLLFTEGPGWFYAMALKKGRDLKVTKGKVHPCSLCRDIVGDTEFLDCISEEINAHANELRMKAFFRNIAG